MVADMTLLKIPSIHAGNLLPLAWQPQQHLVDLRESIEPLAGDERTDGAGDEGKIRIIQILPIAIDHIEHFGFIFAMILVRGVGLSL